MSSDCPTPGQLFHLDPDTNIQNITSFLQECKLAKYKHSNLQEEINSYSMQPLSLDDMIQANFEKKSIIPEVGPKDPTPDTSHLSPEIQGRLKTIFAKHQKLFSRSKHHLGRFTGFEATANIDKKSPINCRQGARNKVLPPSCKQDLQKYKTSGLFELSTGLADDYCANITLVLRNQIKEQRDNTKAGKYVMRQENKKKLSPSKVETKQLDPSTPDSQRSLYRMTLDFRLLNKVTLNEKTAQLPSMQSIESSFFNSFVTTLDLSNCYPSIVIEKESRNYFNFFVESQVWCHARLAQGWCASLAIAQRAVLWTFRDEALNTFRKEKRLTSSQFPFLHFHQFLSGFVDDLAIGSSKDYENALDIHILCIEATFHALEAAGWLIKIEVSTFLNPKFVFLGLFWDLDQQSAMVQNDRVTSILNHRPPRSLPELASRLATLQYHQSHLPLMKRLSIPAGINEGGYYFRY